MTKIRSQKVNLNTDDLPTEEDKMKVIQSLRFLEPYGAIYFNAVLQGKEPYQFSTTITSPAPVYVVELGEGIPTERSADYGWEMIKKITYQMFKVQILKELYAYRNKHFMLRIKRPNNVYPKYFAKIDLPLWNGYEEAEVIFFAKSRHGEEKVQRWVNESIGDVKYMVNYAFSLFCDYFSRKIVKDPEIGFICKLAAFMTKGFRKPERQSRTYLGTVE